MKILPEHYRHMRDTIQASATAEQVKQHRAFIVAEGKAKNVDKRLRWDLHYRAKLSQYVCDNVYPYADDSHVDTALRHIVAELY